MSDYYTQTHPIASFDSKTWAKSYIGVELINRMFNTNVNQNDMLGAESLSRSLRKQDGFNKWSHYHRARKWAKKLCVL